jgi:molybdopterin converting factor small subunit
MGIIGDVKAFLNKRKKEQSKELETLRKIIGDLRAKAVGMKKRWESESDSDKKKKLEKEYKAVRKLLKKSKKRYKKLVSEE